MHTIAPFIPMEKLYPEEPFEVAISAAFSQERRWPVLEEKNCNFKQDCKVKIIGLGLKVTMRPQTVFFFFLINE